MIINVNDENCPICGAILIDGEMYPEDKHCKNRCYEFVVFNSNSHITFFQDISSRIKCHIKNNGDLEYCRELIETIKYWREDERYVLKILEMSG